MLLVPESVPPREASARSAAGLATTTPAPLAKKLSRGRKVLHCTFIDSAASGSEAGRRGQRETAT